MLSVAEVVVMTLEDAHKLAAEVERLNEMMAAMACPWSLYLAFGDGEIGVRFALMARTKIDDA